MRNVSWLVRFTAVTAFVSSLALGASFEGTTVTKHLERTGKDLKGEARQAFGLTSSIYRITTEKKFVAEQVWDCEGDQQGDGTKGDWKEFFNVPKAEKPSRLAAAIKGVGVSTAKRLIDDGTFSNKPRSWSEFKSRIQDADDRYNTGFSYEVLVTFKKENMTNLGYLTEGQCGYKTVWGWVTVPVKQLHHNETRQFDVRIVDAPLLANEKESISISFDGVDDTIYVNSYYNAYTQRKTEQNGVTVIELQGTRKQVRATNDLNLTASVAGSNLSVNIADAGFDADLANVEDKFVTVKVVVDNGWFHAVTDLGSFEKPLSKNSSVTSFVDLVTGVPAKKNLIITYKVRYAGSKFHSGDLTNEKKLKLKLK